MKPLLTNAKYVYKHGGSSLSLYSRAGSRCEGQLKCADDGRDWTALIFKRSNRKIKKENEKTRQSGPFCERGIYTQQFSSTQQHVLYIYPPKKRMDNKQSVKKPGESPGRSSSFSRRKTSNLSSRQAPNFWTLNLTDIRSHGRSPLKKKELLFYYIL